MISTLGLARSMVHRHWSLGPREPPRLAIMTTALAVLVLLAVTGHHNTVGAVSLRGVHLSGSGDGRPSQSGQLGQSGSSAGGSDTETDRPDWLHGGYGDIRLEAEPPPPISSCPLRCRCYYRGFRGSGVSDRLLTVNCTGLGLMEFPENLPAHTQVLDMSSNSVRNLTTLPRLAELMVLDLSRNWLRVVDNRWLFEHVAQLAVLNLAHNRLRQLQDGTFLGLRRLLVLDVSGNRLHRTELHAFADLSSLEVFRMEGNGLFDVQREWFLSMPSLVELRLGDNALSSLDALPLPRLQHLDLSNNRFRTLDHSILAGLDNLRLVNLSDNGQLLEVPGAALRPAVKLDILLLDGLGVTRLGRHAVSGLSALEMSLSYLAELRAVGRDAFHNLSRLRTL
ncbi:hypothetical protein EGW08_010097, partial [Elysia chlorotica]